MNTLLIFQVAQALMAVILLFFIFDIKVVGKQHINSNLPLLIGVLFPLYIIGFIMIVFSLSESINMIVKLTFFSTVIGLIMVIKARMDLKNVYAWPGHFREETTLVKSGIYKYIRHPIYVGIYIFILGTLLFVIAFSNFVSGLLMALVGSILLAFITIATRLEEVHLQKNLGESYALYKKEVHAVFPFGKIIMDDGQKEENEGE